MSGRLRRIVSILALSVLAGLPVSATVCLSVCSSDATAGPVEGMHAGGHHGLQSIAQEPSLPGQSQMHAALAPHCPDRDGAVLETAAVLTSDRAETRALPVGHGVWPSTPASLLVACVDHHAGVSPPGRTSTPARTPLVLRI